jgi:hypothetical protein
VGTSFETSHEWHNDYDFGKDYGFIRVGKENGKTLGESVGMKKILINQNRNLTVISLGYPGNIAGAEKKVRSFGKQELGHEHLQPPTIKYI